MQDFRDNCPALFKGVRAQVVIAFDQIEVTHDAVVVVMVNDVQKASVIAVIIFLLCLSLLVVLDPKGLVIHLMEGQDDKVKCIPVEQRLELRDCVNLDAELKPLPDRNLACILLFECLNPWLSIVTANLLIALSFLQLFSGLRAFYGETRIWPQTFWLYLGFAFLTYVFLTIFSYHFLVRTLIRYGLTLLVLLQIHWYLRPRYVAMAPMSRYILKFAIWGNITGLVIQGGTLLAFSEDTDVLVNNDRAYTTIFIARLIFAIIWAYSIILLDQGNQQLELANKNKQLEELIQIDPLTQLYNRNRFQQSGEDLLRIAYRFARPLSLIILDLDLFKRVNDTWGHAVGDQVLIKVADILRTSTRATDQVIRWGGEEFVILALGTDLEGALHLAEVLRVKIASTPFETVGQMTASFGVAELTDSEGENRLFERADQALYQAKHEGRNRVVAAILESESIHPASVQVSDRI